MRILLLNQAFYPDVAATAQQLSDLAVALTSDGHEVTVIASQRAYDNPERRYASREAWQRVSIHRVWMSGLGKGAKWRRAIDFATFCFSASLQLLFTRRPDVVIALTSPPLISFLGACFAAAKRCRFVYWIMDLNPDEAIVAGWLREKSLAGRVLNCLSVFSLKRADSVIVLDRFMRDRVLAKGILPDKVHVQPPWSHEKQVAFDPAGRVRFRDRHGLTDKFVVMYSGNHSPCHPLDTLLQAAREIVADHSIQFCFVGGGSEFAKVQRFAAENRLSNILCLPYQPLGELGASLSAADLHVVVMGNRFVGTIHPCKIYNILAIQCPFLYIGPSESHVMEIISALGRPNMSPSAAHGDTASVIQHIKAVQALAQRGDSEAFQRLAHQFSSHKLIPEFLGCAGLDSERYREIAL